MHDEHSEEPKPALLRLIYIYTGVSLSLTILAIVLLIPVAQMVWELRHQTQTPLPTESPDALELSRYLDEEGLSIGEAELEAVLRWHQTTAVCSDLE